jgi:transcriptional regulator with XRE-family HTH domain
MDTGLANKIGSAARIARKRLGLSQADAAERAGISAEFYARIERGGTLPSAPTLVALAEALDVSTDVLVGRTAGRQYPKGAREATAAAQDSPEVRRLLRRVRRAAPRVVRILNLLAAELSGKGRAG